MTSGVPGQQAALSPRSAVALMARSLDQISLARVLLNLSRQNELVKLSNPNMSCLEGDDAEEFMLPRLVRSEERIDIRRADVALALTLSLGLRSEEARRSRNENPLWVFWGPPIVESVQSETKSSIRFVPMRCLPTGPQGPGWRLDQRPIVDRRTTIKKLMTRRIDFSS